MPKSVIAGTGMPRLSTCASLAGRATLRRRPSVANSITAAQAEDHGLAARALAASEPVAIAAKRMPAEMGRKNC